MTHVGATSRAIGAAVALAIVGLLSAPMAAAGDVRADPPAVAAFVAVPGVVEFSGRLIARPWQKNFGAEQDQRARDRLVPHVIRHVTQTDEYILAVPAGRSDAQFAAELAATGDYQYVHPDWICYPASAPNDPGFAAQYQHRRMQSVLAWDLTTGSPSVICAFVDTGVDLTHPDLAPRLVSGFNSWDGVPQAAGGDVTDINGHGTAVAGCAAATGNNSLGVAGVGWNLSIMPVRASNLPSGASSLSLITAGARWAVDHGAKVVSVSFSGVTNPTVQTTGQYVSAGGALLCWAAGNNGIPLASGVDWPDVIIVGNSDATDQRAPTSNMGLPIDCVAPGIDVYTTAMGGGLAPQSGTSFSTPIVAGLLGLVFSANPLLTPAEAEAILYRGCELPAGGSDFELGAGRVNAYRSVWVATYGPDKPIPAPDAATTPASEAITIDVLANDADVLGRTLVISGFDGASNLGGTVVRSVGTGPGGRDQLRFTPGATGAHTFSYTLSNGVDSSVGIVSVNVLNPAALRPAEGPAATGAGLAASYFDLSESVQLLLPDFSTLTSVGSSTWNQVNFAATDDDFADSFRIDDVGAVAIGRLTVPADGFYTLSLESSDGSRLLIGDQVVVDNDGLQGMHRASGVIGLAAGAHPLRIEFFERLGVTGLIARIAGPDLPEQVIPAPLLSHVVPIPADFNLDGMVDPDDLSDFITCFFINIAFPGSCPGADFNADGTSDPDDLSDFITVFFL